MKIKSNFYYCLIFMSLLVCHFQSAFAAIDDTLIVSFATAQLNYLPDAVQGVLVTPNGDKIKTGPLGPFGREKIVLINPEEGEYFVYYQALISIKPKVCYIVGGIDVNLCNQPELVIPFAPVDSQIQGFSHSQPIKAGDKTTPLASFSIFK